MFSQKYPNNVRTVSGTVTVQDDDVVLNVDTTLQAATINLMAIVSPWSEQYQLYIIDWSGTAGTRNITIVAPSGFTINGAQQMVLANNGETCMIRIANATKYQGMSSSASQGALTAISVANTVYVMKNGSDSTGVVQRFDKPFLTIAGARAAALTFFTSRSDTARVKIVVEEGYWEEDIYLDKYIDYDLGSSVINGCITDNQVDFGSSGDNVWTNIITGAAKIYNERPTGFLAGLLIYRPNTKLLLYCDTIAAKYDNTVAIFNGRIRVYCNKIYTEANTQTYQFPIEMIQGYLFADYTYSVLEVFNADIFNKPDCRSSVIGFTNGATNKNQVLSLINCRVKATNAFGSDDNESCVSFGNTDASDGKLLLYNCVLFSTNGKSINVISGNTATVYYYHSNMANVAAGGAGTLNVVLGTLTVNAAVEAGY